MINKVTTKYGESFLGVAAYCLRDKRTEAEKERHAKTTGIDISGQSSERVAWVETRNLATKDGWAAARVMSYYAMERENLKRAAGVKATGRKAKGPVAHLCFSWAPELTGKISREEMLKFADGALKALGFEKQQAIILTHTDEPQPHLHLIVSRIDTKTGKMVNRVNDQRILSRYATEHLKDLKGRGIIDKNADYCPQREINARLREEQKKKPKKERIAIRDNNPTTIIHELQTAAVNDNDRRHELIAKLRAGAAEISAAQRQLRKQQRQQWDDLEAGYLATMKRLQTDHSIAVRRAARIFTNHFRDVLHDLKKEQRHAQEEFAANEKRAFGRLKNLMGLDWRRLFAEYELERKRQGPSAMRAVFSVLGDAAVRLQSFMADQRAQERKVLRELGAHEQAARKEIEVLTQQRLAAERQAFFDRREALLREQHHDQQAMNARWEAQTKEYRRAKKTLGIVDRKAIEAEMAKMRAEWERATQQGYGRGR